MYTSFSRKKLKGTTQCSVHFFQPQVWYCTAMQQRKPVRRATLPSSEVEVLRTLCGDSRKHTELRARVTGLYACGWSLSSIAQAFSPPRQRSTVRSWITLTVPPLIDFPKPSSVSSSDSSDASSTLPTAEKMNSTATAKAKAQYRNFNPLKPLLTKTESNTLKKLAPVAARYRSGMRPDSTYAKAHAEFNELLHSVYSRGVSITEITTATESTYRAIARRLGR